MVPLKPPVIQIALDFATTAEALATAALGVAAGVDWLEIGTPLIVCEGLAPIGHMARAFPKFPVLADYKTMDSGWKNVERTRDQGGHLMTVCGGAPDETVLSAIHRGKELDIGVVVDLIGQKDPVARARQCEAWGADLIYLHYGADQRKADASRDSTQWLAEILPAIQAPVGVGCFGIEDAVRAVSLGAELVVIGHPVISAPDAKEQLQQFVQQVRAAYRPRGK